MKLIIKNGKFNGTQYTDEEFTEQFNKFHSGQGELVLTRDLPLGEDEIDTEVDSSVLDELKAAQALAEWKADRQAQVDAIIVTTDVGDWDGDEISQSRMSRAILSMNDTDSTLWIMADNTTATVTKANLTEALKLSGEAQTSMWIRPWN